MPSIRRLADSTNTLNSMLLLLKDLRKAVKSLPAWIAPPGAEKFRRLSLLKIRHPSNTFYTIRRPGRHAAHGEVGVFGPNPIAQHEGRGQNRPVVLAQRTRRWRANASVGAPTLPLAHRSRTRQSAPTRKARPVSSTLERPALLAAPK